MEFGSSTFPLECGRAAPVFTALLLGSRHHSVAAQGQSDCRAAGNPCRQARGNGSRGRNHRRSHHRRGAGPASRRAWGPRKGNGLRFDLQTGRPRLRRVGRPQRVVSLCWEDGARGFRVSDGLFSAPHVDERDDHPSSLRTRFRQNPNGLKTGHSAGASHRSRRSCSCRIGFPGPGPRTCCQASGSEADVARSAHGSRRRPSAPQALQHTVV